MAEIPTLLHKVQRLIVAVLLVYVALVSTHLGEFWPFSIYPMFSRGGHPWVRSLVRDVTNTPDSLLWRAQSEDTLPGDPFALGPAGINENDLSNFVSKSKEWDQERIDGMRKLFGSSLQLRSLMIYYVEGRLDQDRQISVKYRPFILMLPDSTTIDKDLAERHRDMLP